MTSDEPASDTHDAGSAHRALRHWRARGWWRWRALAVVEAGVWGLAAGVAAVALGGRAPVALAAAVGVAAWRAWADAAARDVRTMLRASEARWPALGNALMAWHEVDRGTLMASPVFRDRLAQQARSALVPGRWPAPRSPRAWGAALVTLALSLTLLLVMPQSRGVPDVVRPGLRTDEARSLAVSVSVRYRITPPAYTRHPAVETSDATAVEALVGSRLDVELDGLPDGARAQFAGAALSLDSSDAGRGTASTTVRETGLLTVTHADGSPLIVTAVQAVPDRPPLVRIPTPGQDLRITDVTRRIPIEVDASDDLGLASLRVRYTHVTGSGETFEFVDGELPVAVSRSTDAWRARGTLDLAALQLAPGDSVVYWAIARDGRSDAAGLSESERYLVEVPRPGQLAAGDFSLPEAEQRYALSQRMVIQLTEQLRERRGELPDDEYTREAQGLAAQQRRVRAEFVFLMGGEVVDEVEEAAHSHDVEAGRLDNSGQRELLEAVRQMAQAEQRLTDADLDAALPFEYRALEALQAAFGKARYFMRTLPVRVAIDPDRRGTGDLALAGASTWARTPLPPNAAARGRHALGALLALTPATAAVDVARVADDLLALDADTVEWLTAVQALTAAYGAEVADAERQRAIDAAAAALRDRLAAGSPQVVPLALPVGRDEAALASAGGPR